MAARDQQISSPHVSSPLGASPQPTPSSAKKRPIPPMDSYELYESVSSGPHTSFFSDKNPHETAGVDATSYFTPWDQVSLDAEERSFLWKPDRSYSVSTAPQFSLKRNETKLGGGGTPGCFGVYHSSFTSFIEDANTCSFRDNPQLGDVYLHHVTQADGYQIFVYYGGSEGWVEADERSPLVHPAKKHSNRRLALRGGFATPDWMSESAEVGHLLELREIEGQDEPTPSKKT